MQKTRRNWDAVPASELVGKVMQEFGLSRGREHRAVFRARENIVPGPVAKHARTASFRGGKLVVTVTSAPLLEELRCFRGGEFLGLLNEELAKEPEGGLVFVRRIEFRSN